MTSGSIRGKYPFPTASSAGELGCATPGLHGSAGRFPDPVRGDPGHGGRDRECPESRMIRGGSEFASVALRRYAMRKCLVRAWSVGWQVRGGPQPLGRVDGRPGRDRGRCGRGEGGAAAPADSAGPGHAEGRRSLLPGHGSERPSADVLLRESDHHAGEEPGGLGRGGLAGVQVGLVEGYPPGRHDALRYGGDLRAGESNRNQAPQAGAGGSRRGVRGRGHRVWGAPLSGVRDPDRLPAIRGYALHQPPGQPDGPADERGSHGRGEAGIRRVFRRVSLERETSRKERVPEFRRTGRRLQHGSGRHRGEPQGAPPRRAGLHGPRQLRPGYLQHLLHRRRSTPGR